MTRAIANRHAVITGASRGIGAAIALALVQAKAKVTLMGRDLQSLQRFAQTLPAGSVHHIAAVDVADHQAMADAIHAAALALGPIHFLINNAGQAQSCPIGETEPQLWHQMLAVNLTGTYNGIHAALPSLRSSATAAEPARIINIASTAGLQGYPQVAAYVAAKHGVVGLTRALALELAKDHITVNAVCPGYTATDIATQAIEIVSKNTGKTAEQARAMIAKRNPQQRLIEPQEVAATVLWLCDPASASINGQAIAIDGGELAG